jgi:hypothetical protein
MLLHSRRVENIALGRVAYGSMPTWVATIS